MEMKLTQIRGPSPASPEAVSVRTPPSQEFGVEVLDRAATPGPVVYTPPRFQKAVARNIRTDNLPYWEALSHWESESDFFPTPSILGGILKYL